LRSVLLEVEKGRFRVTLRNTLECNTNFIAVRSLRLSIHTI